MNQPSTKICIFPGCERPAAPAHPLGGPQPSFCALEAHNALTAHQERLRRDGESVDGTGDRREGALAGDRDEPQA
ncbi:MAG: hypothetical protein ACR2OB_07560 [Solirubrobacteraceae bacterium]